ncbi:hypothetical protein B0J11DRAFT_611710 [Dendryphion nanum]|uniref:Uncharacterized protein n=1 Tax=Dendryphion nanum TaxID=256645 RepID=A0A9P9EFX5_9PLEO|nr:hypothetical protein B0J11DRAFT_611710 [Dendryphion nanum]
MQTYSYRRLTRPKSEPNLQYLNLISYTISTPSTIQSPVSTRPHIQSTATVFCNTFNDIQVPSSPTFYKQNKRPHKPKPQEVIELRAVRRTIPQTYSFRYRFGERIGKRPLGPRSMQGAKDHVTEGALAFDETNKTTELTRRELTQRDTKSELREFDASDEEHEICKKENIIADEEKDSPVNEQPTVLSKDKSVYTSRFQEDFSVSGQFTKEGENMGLIIDGTNS